MRAGTKYRENKKPRHIGESASKREEGGGREWSGVKWSAKERKKAAGEGGRRGRKCTGEGKELCEGTRLKRM